MGNSQICKNCDRLTSDNGLEGRITNKRQIITLNFPPKLPTSHQDVQTSIQEASQLSLPVKFKNFTGFERVEYKAGWMYEGDLANGIREGRGRMTWPTGDYYEGEFVNGRACGRGIFQTTNGTRYEGEFIND
jgi:hypothetical protein